MALKDNPSPSTSLAESIIVIVPSSAITCRPISVNSGASFMDVTTSVNISVNVKPISLTVTVILALP